MARAIAVEDRLPDALPQVRHRLVLAAERWDAHIAELRRLVDRVEAHVNEKGWGWELGPIRELIDKVEVKGREQIHKALERFDELRPIKTGKSTVWLVWRGEGVLSVHWPNDGQKGCTVRLKLGKISTVTVLGIGVLTAKEQRLYGLGWRASDATRSKDNYSAMSTADLAQVLAWAPAVPGKMWIHAEYIGLTLEGPHVHWQVRALDHVEEVGDKASVLGEAFSSPLSALGHVLGDGSPYAKRDGKRALIIAAGGKALDMLAEALEGAMRTIGVRGRVHVGCRYVAVWGTAARRLAGWIVENAPTQLRGLLDVTRFDKWTRLKAVAESPREAPAIVVDGYRWGLHLYRDGLHAETRVVGVIDAVRGLGLSPRVHGRGHRVYLSNADTWRLVGWAARRDPTILERVEAYLRRWLGTDKAKAAEKELKKLAQLQGQR